MCPWCDVHRDKFVDEYSKNIPIQTNAQKNLGVREVQESRWTLDDIRHAQGGGWRGGVMARLGSRPYCLMAGPSLRRPAPELAKTQSLVTFGPS